MSAHGGDSAGERFLIAGARLSRPRHAGSVKNADKFGNGVKNSAEKGQFSRSDSRDLQSHARAFHPVSVEAAPSFEPRTRANPMKLPVPVFIIFKLISRIY